MKPTNHASVRTEHAPTKEKAAPDSSTGTASNNAITDRNHTALDPLKGWFDLAKPSRERQQKKAWKRGKQRGRIDGVLLANVLIVVVVALALGVMYA